MMLLYEQLHDFRTSTKTKHMASKQFDGRTVLVTGAGRGIGAAISGLLAWVVVCFFPSCSARTLFCEGGRWVP